MKKKRKYKEARPLPGHLFKWYAFLLLLLLNRTWKAITTNSISLDNLLSPLLNLPSLHKDAANWLKYHFTFYIVL